MNSFFNYTNGLAQDIECNSLNCSSYPTQLMSAKNFNLQSTIAEESLPSPSSTQYNSEDSEALTSPSQGMSPYLQRTASRKSTEDSENYTEEASSEDEMCQDDQEEGQEYFKLDEKRESMLKKLATKYKYDWKKVTNKFNKVNGTNFAPSDLRDKYKNLPKPNMALRVKFTHEEDLLIAKCFNQFGCDWVQTATYFPTRTPIMLKNRYYSFIRKHDLLSNMLNETAEGHQEQIDNKAVEVEVKSEIKINEVIIETSEIIVKSGIKNLIENYHGSFFNKQIFDMESCLSSDLCVRVASNNYYMY